MYIINIFELSSLTIGFIIGYRKYYESYKIFKSFLASLIWGLTFGCVSSFFAYSTGTALRNCIQFLRQRPNLKDDIWQFLMSIKPMNAIELDYMRRNANVSFYRALEAGKHPKDLRSSNINPRDRYM